MAQMCWILLICLLLQACQPINAGVNPAPKIPDREEKVTNMSSPNTGQTQNRYLALGDSYTIGEGVDDEGRWPYQLMEALRGEGLILTDLEIIARTEWTASELLAAMDDRNPQGSFDMVSLLIGVNNQFRGNLEEEYRRDLNVLINRAIELAGANPGHVMVLTIPDWGVMPFAEGRNRRKISQEIDLFNSIVIEQAREAGVVLVNVTPISRQAVMRPEYVAADGLHPSAVQYAEWVKIILPEARNILE